mmetsp:Transcript_48290/g.114899  ORF Transcript_48290/g.114899 Transcript_48290/m.114899 type:complete len:1308 (-) Transcript_48290:123-4046(-)|eukprot:CAMPEP_0180159658 /NCGR_PEP_ID=MMETSP0986-20121125/27652_1 /TAXON_ID=697907 /ORGANISM="non described non described, Strain CCMP2293" /LENGTH=1307 /DNA_ID=CAMNT_0022109779 /DNA_START=83 /DNA_END=4006 /DNA_ORIENTATION=-
MAGRFRSGALATGSGPVQAQGAEEETLKVQHLERATRQLNLRAHSAEDRLMRAMAKFSTIKPTVSSIEACRDGSFEIMTVQSRDELGQVAQWEDHATKLFAPAQVLRAELRAPTETCIVEREVSQFEVVVQLMNGSLNIKVLPDLTIHQVQRDDLDCEEGDRIVQVDGKAITDISELREIVKGKPEFLTLVIENSRSALFTVRDPTAHAWEIVSVPSTSVFREGKLRPGDVVLRVNGTKVTGLDAGKILHEETATVDFVSGDTELSRRIKTKGIMSYVTEVSEVDLSVHEAGYHVSLLSFFPDMYVGNYRVGIFLGSHQIGGEFDFVVSEGPADLARSEIHREGGWTCVSGEALTFTLVAFDASGNKKSRGGEKVVYGEAKVKDNKNGSYTITLEPKVAGYHKIELMINDRPFISSPAVEVVPAAVHTPSCQVEFQSAWMLSQPQTKNSTDPMAISAGGDLTVVVRLVDKFGNARPHDQDVIELVQHSACFRDHPVNTPLTLSPDISDAGSYSFSALVTVASTKDLQGNFELTDLEILVNGKPICERRWKLDVHPGEPSLEKCLATIPPAGLPTVAGEEFEFDILVKDVWDNLCNHRSDVVELFEYDRMQGAQWDDFTMKPSGHGAYTVTGTRTVAGSFHFSFSVNSSKLDTEQHVYSLHVSPAEISVNQCITSGETKAVVGGYVALLVSLRDQFGNVCVQQAARTTVKVGKLRLVAGDVDPANLVVVNRVSHVEAYQGIENTHQVVISSEQAVQISLDILADDMRFETVNVEFTADRLEQGSCTVEGLPDSVIAGEPFYITVRLTDAFLNGLKGLESFIHLQVEDASVRPEQPVMQKVEGTDIGKGYYKMGFKMLKAYPTGNVKVMVGDKFLKWSSLESLPAKASATLSEVEAPAQTSVHFPLLIHGIFRDEFGNVSPSSLSLLSVEVEGCGLSAKDANFVVDRAGRFQVILVARRKGLLRVTVKVAGVAAKDINIEVRGLDTWSKEDAASWAMTLGQLTPQLKVTSRHLANEFRKQGVTGSKIAGGLLDRGALHFAFGIEELQTAEFIANVFHDLCKSHGGKVDAIPSTYTPWSWATQGKPNKIVSLDDSDPAFLKVQQRLESAIPSSSVTSVQRVEYYDTYEKYSVVRQIVAFYDQDCDPNERYLWYGADMGSNYSEILEKGFTGASMSSRRDHMVYGLGFYFSPDARLADYITSLGATSGGTERRLLLCRVACGKVAERPPLPAGSVEDELKKPVNKMPPTGFQSVSSKDHTEVITYLDNTAYPEFVVTYKAAYRSEVAWPSASDSLASDSELLRLDQVPAEL